MAIGPSEQHRNGPKSCHNRWRVVQFLNYPLFHVDETFKKKSRFVYVKQQFSSLDNSRLACIELIVFQQLIWHLSKSECFFDAKSDFDKEVSILYVFYRGHLFGAKSVGGYAQIKHSQCAPLRTPSS